MSDVNIDLSSTKKRRTLWIVLFLNILIAIGFFITGYQADFEFAYRQWAG